MRKLILILVAFGVANIQAMETKYGIGYSNKEISSGGQSVDWDNIELSYYVSFDNNFAAEFSLSTGVKDKTVDEGNDMVKYKGDTSYFLKGIYNINDTFYISGIYADVWDVFRRSSQKARSCSGAEAVEQMLNASVDDTSTIVRDDLLTDLEADSVALPSVPESQ